MIYYKKGYKYQLVRNAHFKVGVIPGEKVSTDYINLLTTGDLFIKKGYAWDGPSGPTFDTKSSMQGSLVHDALYELLRKELLDPKWRHQADRELRDICKKDGMWGCRAELWYNAVRNAAGPAADPNNKKKVYKAGR